VKKKLLYIGMMLLTAIIWGFAFVAQVAGAGSVPTNTFNFLRYVLGVISLIPVIFVFERKALKREQYRHYAVASLLTGFVLFSASTLQQYGVMLTGSAGISGFITGLYTVLIPIASAILFREKTRWNVWVGTLCAISGLFLLCYRVGEGFHFGLGELVLLIGALFWTAHVIIIGRMGQSLPSIHYAMGQFVVCTALSFIAMVLFEEPSLVGIWDAKWNIAYCGVLSVGVAYTLQVVAQKRIPPAFAAIILSTESVFSAVGGAIFGYDSITWLGYVGCAIIFFGIVISQVSKKTKTENIESAQ